MVDELAPDAVDVYLVKDGDGEKWLATFRNRIYANFFINELTNLPHDAKSRLEVRELE